MQEGPGAATTKQPVFLNPATGAGRLAEEERSQLRPKDSTDYPGALGSGRRQSVLAVGMGSAKIFRESTGACKLLEMTERSMIMLNYKVSPAEVCRKQPRHLTRLF